ncbi:hypothetical protein AKJ09_06648 [Labilithrix luteola]|uniref:Uncharacterized protein n=1 Tax=Labilithrix luteola TaxID=1391654 RepID=A0A0K1Q3M1_9BACT|nr:hypothetical protein AKJ09_06648 [Labilithrix luteola]
MPSARRTPDARARDSHIRRIEFSRPAKPSDLWSLLVEDEPSVSGQGAFQSAESGRR